MLKWLQKNIYWLIASVLLLLLSIFVFSKVEAVTEINFRLSRDDYTADISLHESDDGNLYVFLPSYAQMDRLEIVVPKGMEVVLGDVPLTDGMTCEFFSYETPYAYRVDGEYIADLQFYRSANVASMFIQTVSGSMDDIYKDKNNSEIISVTVMTEEGELDYKDLAASIKGRGNATWGYAKKPYSLTLSENAQLLGMKSGKNWVLLANARDETNLNNYIVMDMAKRVGDVWSPSYTFLDLYLNDQYAGLYLLTEKVETGDTRLNIDVQNGDFLCKIDLTFRIDTLHNPFDVGNGRAVEITSPWALNDDEKSAIEEKVGEMESIIFSGADLNAVEEFDLDSWTRRYLIDEISANIDSDLASSYFYYSDGVFYAGPIWDYDRTFGNSYRNQSSTAFIAKNEQKSFQYRSSYYAALYNNPSFYSYMVSVYQRDFLPVLNELVDKDIEAFATKIESAARMNALRWGKMYASLLAVEPNTVHTVDGLRNYLKQRISFLSRAWNDGVEFVSVIFEEDEESAYGHLSIEKGSVLETDIIDTENTIWIDIATGETVDFSQPLETDIVIARKKELGETVTEDEEPEDAEIAEPAEGESESSLSHFERVIIFLSSHKSTLLSIAAISVALLCFGVIDIRQRKAEGRNASESE